MQPQQESLEEKSLEKSLETQQDVNYKEMNYHNNTNNSLSYPYCWCKLKAIIRVSQSKQNPGRPFYTCPDNRCNFFKWLKSSETKSNKRKIKIEKDTDSLTLKDIFNSIVQLSKKSTLEPPLKKRKTNLDISNQLNLHTSLLKEIRDCLNNILSLMYEKDNFDSKKDLKYNSKEHEPITLDELLDDDEEDEKVSVENIKNTSMEL